MSTILRRVQQVTAALLGADKDTDVQQLKTSVHEDHKPRFVDLALYSCTNADVLNHVLNLEYTEQTAAGNDPIEYFARCLEDLPDAYFVSRHHQRYQANFVPPDQKETPCQFLSNLQVLLSFVCNCIQTRPESITGQALRRLYITLLSRQSKRALYYTANICALIEQFMRLGSALLQQSGQRIELTAAELEDALWPIRTYQSDELKNWPHSLFLTLIKDCLPEEWHKVQYKLVNPNANISFLIRQEICHYQNKDLLYFLLSTARPGGQISIAPHVKQLYEDTVDQGRNQPNIVFEILCSIPEFASYTCIQIATCGNSGMRDNTIRAIIRAKNIRNIIITLNNYATAHMQAPDFMDLASNILLNEARELNPALDSQMEE